MGNTINRREFVLRTAALAAVAVCGKIALADEKNAYVERVFAKTDAQKAPPIPRGRRSSGGLGYFRLDDDPDGVLLKFSFFVKECGMDEKRRAKKEKSLQCPV